ncbi:uncharacterized protein RCC_01221 [Ramularia collo-cygni]|uniref:Uncharacterized protein n=1 Tax=Ramularia collo-cygni TaxID=112498 RepID=A0A2D3UNY7_9PEZI|nr:uncharacterized protein RCC_01221 [Ramularia collo-cygni]CZT15358.1 uncharacterized protein RCC_01221 [Ramularia collo-cygni]
MADAPPQATETVIKFSGDTATDAEMLNVVMAKIEAELARRPSLGKAAGYRIRKQGQEDANRIRKFENYKGPDHATLAELETNLDSWTRSPLIFWDGIFSAGFELGEPQAYPALCHMQLEKSDDDDA